MHKEVKRPPHAAACESFNLVYEFYGCQRFSQKTTVLNQITPLYVILSGEKRLRFAESKFCGSSEASKQNRGANATMGYGWEFWWLAMANVTFR